jgi:hypothetical protein
MFVLIVSPSSGRGLPSLHCHDVIVHLGGNPCSSQVCELKLPAGGRYHGYPVCTELTPDVEQITSARGTGAGEAERVTYTWRQFELID